MASNLSLKYSKREGYHQTTKKAEHTLTLWQQITDADTISFTFCFSLMIVFKFIAVTTTGGISSLFFEEGRIRMSFGQSTVTSNLHQLTCHWFNQAFKKERKVAQKGLQ